MRVNTPPSKLSSERVAPVVGHNMSTPPRQPLGQRGRSRSRGRISEAAGSTSPQKSARAHATPPRTPPRASSFARSKHNAKVVGYTEHHLLSGELQISEQQCAGAEAFARSYLTEAKLFDQQRRAFQDELKELREGGLACAVERERLQAEATNSVTEAASLQEQLKKQLVGRQSAVESARQVICKMEKQEMEAARKLSNRLHAWEVEVALHVQNGFTNRVDPVIFANNAPMFERVAALIRQEKACTDERKEGLQLLVDKQIEVTRAADAAELEGLRAQLAQACELRQHVGDATSKATTRYFKEELGLLRQQLDDSESQRAAADEGREALRLQHSYALQALRASLERSCNWIPEQVGRGVGSAAAAAAAAAEGAAAAAAAEAAPREAELRSELKAALSRGDALESEAAVLRLEAGRLRQEVVTLQAAGLRSVVVTQDGGFGSADWAVREHRRLAAETGLLVPELRAAEAPLAEARAALAEEQRARGRQTDELASALDGEKRRRARLQKRYGALQLETEDQLLRLQTASIEQQELLQLAEARGSRLDTELAEERKLRLESASNLFRLRGTIVKQIVTKLSGDLVGRCFRAWRDCTQQHAAFKSLQGRGELVISQPSPGEASRDGKRSPSPYVASEVRANSFRPSSSPNTRFAA